MDISLSYRGDNSSFLQPLEKVIRLRFLPCLLGWDSPSDVERELFALPTRFGGLGLLNPVECCSTEYEGSLHLSDALTLAIIQQSLPPSNLSQLTRGIRNTNLPRSATIIRLLQILSGVAFLLRDNWQSI